MRETKTKINKILVSIISAGIVLLQAIPAFASSQSVGTIDADDISANDMKGSLSTVSSYYVPEGATEMRLPVYFGFESSKLWENYTYLSGYAYYGATTNSFGIFTGGSTNVKRVYFEPSNTDNIRAIWKESTSLRLYFDNFRITGSASTVANICIGYIIYTFDPAPTGFTYIPPNSYTPAITPSPIYMRGSAYEYGFTDSIIYALDNSTSVEDMLTTLNYIDQNTGYLPDILYELQQTHTNLYNLLTQIWNTDVAVLGVDRDIYNTVLSIFAILNDQFNAQESHAEDVADNIEQNMSNLAHDMELTKPSMVADIADDYIEQIDTSYNTSIFGALFNPIIILMLCVVFAFAILSYMLYGGQ